MNLHETKNENLIDYEGDFQLNWLIVIEPIEHKTNIRFQNVDVFESYINAIAIDYESEHNIFTGCLKKLNTPQFHRIKRSLYGRGTDFKQDIVEYIGDNCYNPTTGKCFKKGNTYFTKKVYTQEFLTFVRTEKYRSRVITSATIQPFCRKHNIIIGCFDGTRINPRNITEKDIALKVHNNHFCLIWKSQNISFNQVRKDESKPNFKVFDNVRSDKHVKSLIKNENKPNMVQSPLTNIVVYDLETFNKIRAVPYRSCIYKLKL